MTISAEEIARIASLYASRFGRPVDASLVEATLQEIEHYGGASGGQMIETFAQRAPFPVILNTTRPVATITSVVERRGSGAPVTLSATGDFRLIDTWRIARTPDGPNPGDVWGGEVTVSYTTQVDGALRDRIATELLALSASFSTKTRVQVGDRLGWTNREDHAARRRELLAELARGPLVMAL